MKPKPFTRESQRNIFRSHKNILIAGVLLLLAIGIIFSTKSRIGSVSNTKPTSITHESTSSDLAVQQDLEILGTQGLEREFFQADIPTPAIDISASDEFLANPPDTKITPLPTEQPNTPQQNQEKKIIKNGYLSFSVTNIEVAADTITKVAKSNGGDSMSRDITGEDQRNRLGTMTLRIPSENFEQAFVALKQIASVIHSESISTSDVTEQFVDTQTRLSTKKSHEQRLVSFFEEAEDVEDLILIEKELSRVRGEIELIEGRLNRLESQTSFSTITISLEEDVQFGAKNQWRPAQVVKDSANELVTRSQKLIDRLIIISISSLPLIAISLIGLAIAYAVIKKAILAYLNYLEKKR